MHVCREYEARIAELKEQFGQEQADKAKLQLELDKLQKEWDEQLQTLQTQVNHGMASTCTCTCSRHSRLIDGGILLYMCVNS